MPNLDTFDFEALEALVIVQDQSSHQQIKHLKLVIEKYPRIFGSKSEKLKGQLEQLEFPLEELETERAASQAAQPSSSPTTTRSRPRAPRKPLPGDLPREVITHLPAHTCCLDCGGALSQFGEDVSEQLERIPAVYKVIHDVQPKFACAACVQILEAPAPVRPMMACRVPIYWRMCWSRNSQLTRLCIASPECMLGKESTALLKHVWE